MEYANTSAPTLASPPSSVQPTLSVSEPRSPVVQPATLPAPAPAPAPAPTSTPAPLATLGPNYHEHDRTLRKWRLGIRIATATFVAIAMIVFIARGAKQANKRYGDCSAYRCYYYYDFDAYDVISLPIVRPVYQYLTLSGAPG